MSTTAGLGTQEYVAINPVAVWATIFGLGSLLCLVDNIFLVIPLAAIVCAFIALRQIKTAMARRRERAWWRWG
jgi:hypothetical protein